MTNSGSSSFRSFSQVQVEDQARFRAKMRRRCLLVTVLLAIAVSCLGLELLRRSRSGLSPSASPARSLPPIIQAACRMTLYPDTCLAELSSIAGASTARPTQLVSMAIRIAANHTGNALSLAQTTDGGSIRLVLQDCRELMEDAHDHLDRSAIQMANLAGFHGDLNRHLADILTWVTGALSYQTACVDGIAELPAAVAAMTAKGLLSSHLIKFNRQQEKAMETTTIAFGLVHVLFRVSRNISSWRVALQEPPPQPRRIHSQRLPPAVFGVDARGFPSWMPRGHRKLLELPPPTVQQLAPATQPSNSSASSPYQAVVALDGSGSFTKIQSAINAIPTDYEGRYTIYIKAGQYAENIIIHRNLANLMLIGDGIRRTEITGSHNVASGQFTTFRSATVAVSAPNFIAKGITFTNRAGYAGHQAVALRVGGDLAAFDSCSFEGNQDTLYALAQRQYYRNCEISGTIDFIFGNAAAIFQGCKLLVRVPGPRQMNTVTAHGRTLMDAPTGFSFQSCHVMAELGDPSLAGVRSFLGRPWKAYSRTVFMKSTIDGIIDPAGWLSWNVSNPFVHTVYYGEYQNGGAGANTSGRATWPGIHSSMSTPEAEVFSVPSFIDGAQWLPQANINFDNIITN